MGMENGNISDSALKASSEVSAYWTAIQQKTIPFCNSYELKTKKMVCTYSYGKKILGAINRLVKWSAICYFWQMSGATGPSKGRLNHRTSYRAQWNNKGQWIQVDFGKVAKVTKVGTQGCHYQDYCNKDWVSKYTVSYSVNGGYFENQLHKSSDDRRVS